MRSRIYTGKVMHSRSWPIQHRFEYPVYLYAFDLDELSELDRTTPLFGYNRIRPVSLHDRDYLLPQEGSIRQKLDRVLAMAGDCEQVHRVEMVTAARYFNYVFNPATFFYCYEADDSLHSVVVQVNNTFGEMHLYILRQGMSPRPGYLGHYATEKAFHVSPFFDRKGSYEFLLSDIREGDLDIIIHYYQDDNPVFAARLQGTSRPFSQAGLTRTLIRYPLAAALTMPRIIWQAARLHFQRRLPIFHKPAPMSAMTVRGSPPGLTERVGKALLLSFFSRIQRGSLSITFPDGRWRVLGRPGSGQEASLTVRDNAFFRRTLTKGSIGFGESFTAGEWVTSDLTRVLTVLAGNLPSLQEGSHWPSLTGRMTEYLRHLLRHNTVRRSPRNIREHYDLGNDFFALFLDPTMTYSCALFESPDEDLEAAQLRKLRSVMELADIGSSHHVLEMGCGWGSFAIEAARTRGCRVTGITISLAQLELAEEKVREAGLADLVDVEMRDYRHIEGTYDRIVSIEMLEAVGHANIGCFFKACERALAPGGRIVIQTITIPDSRYRSYRRSSDWIRKHIFTGGHLPSVGIIRKTLERETELRISDLRDIGPHYARTLHRWRENLLAARERVMDLGFDDTFLRKWEYYFSYCESGFAEGVIQDHQIVLERVTD